MTEYRSLHGAASANAVAQAPDASEDDANEHFTWTASKVVLSVFLFLLAGLAEIGGGWLVWQAVRVRGPQVVHWWKDSKAVAYAVAGACSLVAYGFVPTAQPPPTFGRLYAVYGGFFVALSFLWGWLVDGEKPDKGDWIGGVIAIAGVAAAWFWPR